MLLNQGGRIYRGAALLAAIAAMTTTPTAQAQISGRQLARLPAPLSQRLFATSHRAGTEPRISFLVTGPPGPDTLPLGPQLGGIALAPGDVDAWLRKHPGIRLSAAPPRRPLLDNVRGLTRANAAREQTGLDGSGVIVGIIDTGIDLQHDDFRNADGSTRIAWLSVRGQPRGVHVALEQRYGCSDPNQPPCAIFSGAEIDILLNTDPSKLPPDVGGHGTHVASIAAGNGGIRDPAVAPRYAGIAPGATLIVAAPNNNGGFSDADIVNAARFIFDQADTMGMPAVVNVSLGSDFGPHDGTSAFERGLADLVGDEHPGRSIVVAAGNSGTLFQPQGFGPLGIHTEVTVTEHGTTTVPMLALGASGIIDGGGFVWVTFDPDDEVSIGLEGPEGTWLTQVEPGTESGFEEGAVSGAIINQLINDNSSLPPGTNGAVIAWNGAWEGEAPVTLVLEGHGHAQLWVTGAGAARASASSFGLNFRKAIKAGTVSVPATDPELIAVGCTLNRTAWIPYYDPDLILEISSFGGVSGPVADSVCYFSGAGPTPAGVMKPDIVAPGALVAAALSKAADPRVSSSSIFASASCPEADKPCLLVDETHGLNSGTSMSSPAVAGAVALMLQREPNLTQEQARRALQASARIPRGVVPYDYQSGAGTLDVLHAIAVIDDLSNPARGNWLSSYVNLSAPFARPGAGAEGWVTGIVQLRNSDESIPTDVEGLTLEVTGGEIMQQLESVGPATWTFRVRAAAATGGQQMRISIDRDGESFMRRVLPIQVDPWASEGGVRPVGGCSISAPRSSRPYAGLGFLFLAGLFGLRRAKQR